MINFVHFIESANYSPMGGVSSQNTGIDFESRGFFLSLAVWPYTTISLVLYYSRLSALILVSYSGIISDRDRRQLQLLFIG